MQKYWRIRSRAEKKAGIEIVGFFSAKLEGNLHFEQQKEKCIADDCGDRTNEWW